MKVTLTAATQPLIRTEDNTRFLTAEEFIVYTARVSNPSNQLNIETAPKLLKYCINHEHWSPFEQASLTFEIVTSRDISAQIIRHKSFCFQEFSQRYSSVTELEPFDIRKQAEKNRQSSEDALDLSEEEIEKIKQHLSSGLNLYNEIIQKGGARECARKILPLCTQTTLYMTGSVRSWIHYIQLRSKPETQLEHREIALAVKKVFSNLFPSVAEALEITDKKNETSRKHTLLSDQSNIKPLEEEMKKSLVENNVMIL